VGSFGTLTLLAPVTLSSTGTVAVQCGDTRSQIAEALRMTAVQVGSIH
jgi:hypothetical protein